MRDRVERVVLHSGVTLDVETVDTRIGELRQGACREIVCWGNTRDKYRKYLTSWAMGWRKDRNYWNFLNYYGTTFVFTNDE